MRYKNHRSVYLSGKIPGDKNYKEKFEKYKKERRVEDI